MIAGIAWRSMNVMGNCLVIKIEDVVYEFRDTLCCPTAISWDPTHSIGDPASDVNRLFDCCPLCQTRHLANTLTL